MNKLRDVDAAKMQEIIKLLQLAANRFQERINQLIPDTGVYQRNIIEQATILRIAKEYLDVAISEKIIATVKSITYALSSQQIAERIINRTLEYAKQDVGKNFDTHLQNIVHRVH